MKKSIICLFTLLVLAVAAGGCTQNGGHIGKLFGRWHLDRIETDGVTLPEARGEIYWAFQSETMELMVTFPEHESESVYAVFREDDDTIFLDFRQPGQTPYEQTGLQKESELDVLKLTGRELVCVLHPDPLTEASITYYLTKI